MPEVKCFFKRISNKLTMRSKRKKKLKRSNLMTFQEKGQCLRTRVDSVLIYIYIYLDMGCSCSCKGSSKKNLLGEHNVLCSHSTPCLALFSCLSSLAFNSSSNLYLCLYGPLSVGKMHGPQRQ